MNIAKNWNFAMAFGGNFSYQVTTIPGKVLWDTSRSPSVTSRNSSLLYGSVRLNIGIARLLLVQVSRIELKTKSDLSIALGAGVRPQTDGKTAPHRTFFIAV
jgi:hypothetical protein